MPEPGTGVLVKWLGANPDVTLMSRVNLSGDFSLARVRRKDHSDICVINDQGKGKAWCWRERRKIDHLGHQNIATGKEASDPSRARVRLVFTPGGTAGQAPAMEARFPEARQRPVAAVKFTLKSCPFLPFWLPNGCVPVSFSTPPGGPSRAKWRPITLIRPTPRWAKLLAKANMTKVEIPRDRGGRPIIAIQNRDMQDNEIVIGAHRGGRWLLSDPITDQDGLREDWSMIGWRAADRLLGKPGIAVYLTTSDSGNHQWSAAAYWYFFEFGKTGLVYSGRLTSGRVDNERQGGPGGYYRHLARQHYEMKIVSRGCVRLDRRVADRLCTDGSFRPNKRCKRRPLGRKKNFGGTWRLEGDAFKRGRCRKKGRRAR